MMRVPRPRIVSVRRRLPGEVSPGDTAEVRLDPGLVGLLESLPDCGYQPRYNVPASLGATAAAAVLAPADRPGSYWSGRDLEVEWSRAAGAADTVLVEARLEEFSERLSRFALRGRTGGDACLFRGTLRMMAIRDGRPAGFRSREEYEAVREKLAPPPPKSIPLGRTARIAMDTGYGGEVTARLPYGGGLSLESAAVQQGPRVEFVVRADRPHEVNFGKPWMLEIVAGDHTFRLPIEVPDPNPGRTFYLLTEDCETFDGGPETGDYASRGMDGYGNRNNWMDPEDYRVQMILKPNRLNEIAERHGARWTHFYAATQRFGAEWAAGQSATGEWGRIVAEMDAAVRAGSARHEYCPHIHFDYEPDSALEPQPRLLYDRKTDGILPNHYYHPETNPTHRYHDWDGAARDGISYVKPLGDWSQGDSKAGSLRKSVRHLARLQANRRAPAVGRTGSFDFGKTQQDQAASTQAYLANGLRGNSDAYRPGSAPVAGGQMFWCCEDERQWPIQDLRHARLVQFGITMDTFFQSAEEMNRWFAAHREAAEGPGVHAVLCMTHAMFCAGAPDPFRSLEGGAFGELDRHLAWVTQNYPHVEFATATEALLEYLDYYTPALDNYTQPLVIGGNPAEGRYEFAIRLLGRGIRVDGGHPATLRIAAPPCFSPEDLQELRVTQEGRTIAAERIFDARYQPAVTACLTSRAPVRLEVVLRPEAVAAALGWFGEDGRVVFHEPPEGPEPDLLRLRPPVEEGGRVRFSSDVVRLLMNPVAGHAEPLGRRVHPLGGLTLGIALTMACREGDTAPARIKLRWLKEVDLESGFVAEREGSLVRIRDDSGTLVAQADVVTAKSVGMSADAADTSVCATSTFEDALAAYRQQRAWKVMLAVRKVYATMARGTWRQRAGLVWWIPGFLLGRAPGLEEYELKFPREKF